MAGHVSGEFLTALRLFCDGTAQDWLKKAAALKPFRRSYPCKDDRKEEFPRVAAAAAFIPFPLFKLHTKYACVDSCMIHWISPPPPRSQAHDTPPALVVPPRPSWQVRQIQAAEGPAGFFRGALPRLLVHMPSVAISWTTYETVKVWLSEGASRAEN